jgi:small conductance mechanosensitive channel
MWTPILAQAEQGAADGWFDAYLLPAIKVIVILAVAYLLGKWIELMIRRSAERTRLDDTLARFFGKMAKWGLLVLALLAALSVFGVQTTSFAAVIGASALAIGLAFQGTLANFAAGMMLLIFRPFKVGDVVELSDVTATVDEIDLFQTTLDTFDNRRVIMPNGSIFGSTITNISHHPYRRMDVSVGVAYDADLDRTREVLEQAAASVEGRRDDPAPAVVLTDLGDSAVLWTVRVWADAAVFWDVRQATVRAIKQHLDEAGLSIPFPQMDVHLDQPPDQA